ncbi:MAG: hypothetical protein WBL20_04750, partial [Sphingobium sp.]|uniref:hypothetical protein n=1 Tax=Sphingobium sp. TaxID=1912891 RepID=UPI003BB1704F
APPALNPGEDLAAIVAPSRMLSHMAHSYLRARPCQVISGANSSDFMRTALEQMAPDFGGQMLRLAQTEASEFRLDDPLIDLFASRRDLAEQVPCWRNFTRYVPIFMQSNLGLRGDGYKPERSAGGDIMHSFYLPYCDLWRGDRRFAHILKEALPEQSGKIVGRLSELPDLIEKAAYAST